MALPLRRRTVHFYELKLNPYTQAKVQRPSLAELPDLLKSFQSLAGTGKLPMTVGGTTKVRTKLIDWRYDATNGHYELLLNRADVGVSDTTLRDFDTDRVRKAGKTRREGVEISSHVIVRPNSDGQTALLIMTMGAGLSPGHVERLFRSLCKAAEAKRANRAMFYFDDPSGRKDDDGKPVQYKVRYGFAVYAHPGQTLTDALRVGQFESMELVGYAQKAFDSGGTLQIHERTLKIEAVNPKLVTGAQIINATKRFLKAGNGQDFDKLRLHYKTPAGKPTSATVPINDLDGAFTFKEAIEFNTDVQDQQMELNETILTQMRPLLGWVPR